MTNATTDSPPEFAFTIFTPTYNRAGTLERLYRSIAGQTFRDFEWLVVDDGSTDGTSALIERFVAQSEFPIRYLWQPNAGKHAAFNRGVSEAKGSLFLTIDSDDELISNAVETLHHAWLAIPEEARERFTGVTARCIRQDGRLVGEPVAQSPLDSDSAEATLVLGLHGERIGFHRTDILRAHPFPSVPARFIPEGRVWLDVARHYRTRFIETPARIFHDHDAPRLSGLGRLQRAWGDLEYYRFALAHYAHWWHRAPIEIAKLAIGLRRAELHLGMSASREEFSSLARLWALLAAPIAAMAYARDLLTYVGAPGARMLAARLLLGGRGGPRMAALLSRLGRRRSGPALAVHAMGVVLVLDPGDPRNAELLFSPRTFKADSLPILCRLMASRRKAVVIGENMTFVALQLARAAMPGADILVIETDARQSDRTRAAAQASYTNNVTAVTAPVNSPAPETLDGCDLLLFGELQTARGWVDAMTGECAPAYIALETSQDADTELQIFAAQLRGAGYRSASTASSKFNLWVHSAADSTRPDSA